MNDVEYIKGQLQSWRSCINWIDKTYPQREFEIQHELNGLKATSYEEHIGGTVSNESLRRSTLNDKMNKLKRMLRHRENTIAECERIVSLVQEQYQSIFEYKYKYKSTDSYIAKKTGYEVDTIRKTCAREIKRIGNQ